MDRCSEEGVVGSCRGKEEAEDRSIGSDRSVGSCCGKEEADDRSVGSDRYRAIGSCRGKGEAENRRISALKKVSCRGKEEDRCSEERCCWVLPWKGKGRRSVSWEEDNGRSVS